MNEWKKVKLRELITIRNGKDHKLLHDGIYPVYGSGGIMRYVDRFLYDKESVLLTRKGTLNNIQYAKSPFWTVDTCYYTVVDTEKVNPYFLYRYLGLFDIESLNTGSAVPSMTFDKYYSLDIHLPSIDTQQRIATILSRYDSLIENYQKQIKLLEEFAQRLYKEWFVDLRFPGHENVQIVDDVPEGWEKKKIFELGKVITGKTPSTANKANYGGNIPFITIPDMHNGIYPISSQTLSKQGAESQLGKYIPENSLMVSCIGTAGLVCISETLCQTNQQINSLVLDNDIKLYYMYFTFLSLKEHLNNIGSNGATMTNVNKSKFENIEVVVPIDSLLDSFNIIANNTFVKIKNLSLQIRHLIEARDRLLPKLMNGKIEV